MFARQDLYMPTFGNDSFFEFIDRFLDVPEKEIL
jgi:hypothetical protein